MDDAPRSGFVMSRLGLGLIAVGFALGLVFSRARDICSSRLAPELLVVATGCFLAGFALCLPARARRILLVVLAVLAVPALAGAIALTVAADGWC